MIDHCHFRSTERGAYSLKSTGVVRKLDNLGRIVIPIELRKTMDISIKEYYSSENSDLKLKYDPYDFSLYK